ncbi:MAG: hypothetical protein ABI823_21210 [Bryobacteraceae bacterium]
MPDERNEGGSAAVARPGSLSLKTKLLISLLFAAGAYLLLLSTPWIPGADDGYRHVKFAHRLATEGRAALADPWRLLYFWPKPIDGWFGFHLLLAPLTLLFNLVTASKVLVSLICGAITFAVLELLEDVGAAYPLAWLIVTVFGSGIVLYRATYGRPFLFSILLTLFATLFVLRRNAWGVFAVSAIHAFSYSIVFLVGLPVVAYLLVRRDKRSLVMTGAFVLGLAAGMAANPYFPENVRFVVTQTLAPLTLGVSQDLDVGGELQPLSIWWIVSSLPATLLFLWGTVTILRDRRRPADAGAPWILFVMSSLTLLASLRVARTFDYFVPFAVLFGASALSGWVASKKCDAAVLAGLAFLFCLLNLFTTWRAVSTTASPLKFEGASNYLLQQPESSIVFNTWWGQYHFLYFLNSRSRYITGIDPTFFYLMDQRRYWLWRHISNDEPATCDTPVCTPDRALSIAPVIAKEFAAAFVVIENARTPHLLEYLRKAPEFKEVHRDPLASVFAAVP